MVYPAHPSDPSYLYPTQESSDQKQKRFEMSFQTSVLGIYNRVSSKNRSVDQQLSQIKQGIDSGKSPDQLAHSLNLVISQLNQNIKTGEPFLTFQFTQESEVAALTTHLIGIKKCIAALSEEGKMPSALSHQLMQSLDRLQKEMGQSTSPDTIQQLNDVIQKANHALPPAFQLPTYTI